MTTHRASREPPFAVVCFLLWLSLLWLSLGTLHGCGDPTLPSQVTTPLDIPAGVYERREPLRLTTADSALLGATNGLTELRFLEPCPRDGCIQLAGPQLKLTNLKVYVPSGPAIVIRNGHRISVRSVYLRRSDDARGPALSVEESSDVLLSDIVADAGGGTAVVVERSRRVVLERSDLRDAWVGLGVYGTEAMDVVTSRFEENAIGIELGRQAQPASLLRLERNSVRNNNRSHPIAGQTGGVGIRLADADQIEINDNEIADHATAALIVGTLGALRLDANQLHHEAQPLLLQGPSIGDPTQGRVDARWCISQSWLTTEALRQRPEIVTGDCPIETLPTLALAL
ncbi:MAG: right-handed parallel beta-helix repeat-containing protein [Pseudomonadota bacterium]